MFSIFVRAISANAPEPPFVTQVCPKIPSPCLQFEDIGSPNLFDNSRKIHPQC
jgi:hypothetical protein